ncbi:DUF4407 domain-containing protein [Nonomuraea sp. NPDC026600]|uniref:DUF4407 domain-containing protein n=1 Tax=Nonomuraea sp. NPDC026600 TaxID=3155363 RepID=UPI0033F3725D
MAVHTEAAASASPEGSDWAATRAFARHVRRSASREKRVWRWLRTLAGVNEDVLDHFPEERARYTRLGAIVLNTGLLAGLSMLAALTKFVDAPWALLLLVAAFWSWVIMCIDTWLLSSTHGTNGGAAFWVRLMLSVVIGLAIAEPLLLKVFEPAIHRQVAADRVEERANKESDLRSCNPVPYTKLSDPESARCADDGLLISVRTAPATLEHALQEAKGQSKLLQSQIDDTDGRIAAAEDLARRECNGQTGSGLSGRAGVGPNCRRDRAVADRLRRTSGNRQRQKDVTALQAKIVDLQSQLKAGNGSYAAQIDAGIKAKLPSEAGPIGILEEDKALGNLSATSLFVFVGQWLLRILLIIIDCLPVLTKKLSPMTAYDAAVARQLVTDDVLHAAKDDLKRQRDLAVTNVERARVRKEEDDGLRAIEEQDEADRHRREEELNHRIDALAADLRNRATTA